MRRGFAALGALALPALVALGCGGDEAPKQAAAPRPMAPTARHAAAARAENHPPVIESVALVPEDPRPGQRVEARALASDPDGDALRLGYEWSVDGRSVPARAEVFDGRLEKGSRLEVRVVATDGFAESEPVSARAAVGNQPPVVSGLSYSGGSKLVPGDPLVVEPIASDPDGDELEFHYTWLVNDEEQEVEGGSLPTAKLKRGDRVRVLVVADDGVEESAALEGVELRVENSPARILGMPPVVRDGDTFRWSFEAEDPDGDRRLRFHLVEAPRGMTIDAVLGTASWRPTPDQAGVHPVEVAVEDPYGEGAALRFEVTVSERSGAGAPPAKPAP